MFMTLGLGSADNPTTISKYIKEGAIEFFAGYVPRVWLDKYGWEVCPNRRTLGPSYNFSQVSELRDCINAVHDLGGTINLAVNAHDNGAERMGIIHDMFDLFETLEPDGYIIADPAIMYCMKKWDITRKIHLSTGVGCFNSESVRFFCEQFNIRRLVIPRKISIHEMQLMIEALKDIKLQYEVMIIGYRCYFNDEDCHSVHSGSRRNLCGDMITAPFITTNRLPANWKDMVDDMKTGGLANLTIGSTLDKFRKEWTKTTPPQQLDFHTHYCGEEGLDGELARALIQTCGLCAIKPLRDIGVEVLKVPLRGDEDNKLRLVHFVSQVMRAENPTRAFCRSLVNSPSFCNEPSSCYYYVPEEVQ